MISSSRVAGFLAGLLIAAVVVVTAERAAPTEVERPGDSLTETVAAVVTGGATEARANQQEVSCPCFHRIMCCWDALLEWWFEHGHWPGVDDEADEGGDSDEVLIRTNPSEPPNGEPTEVG